MTRKLGTDGPAVSAIGLGAMGMSDLYGPSDRAESIATLHAALEAGVNLIDTGDFYGSGHNEMLIAEALAGHRREDVVLSVKFGALRDPAGGWGGNDCSPRAMKNSLAQSMQRLRTDYIDVYRPARLDPNVPIEDTVGAMAEMVQAGYIRHIGLSEVSMETLRRAHAVHPIADLQIEYSVISRSPDAILNELRDLGVGLTAYGVLSRGLISGHWNKAREGERDFRAINPRFQGENLDHNLQLVERLRAMAQAKGITVAQLAIAWVMARDPLVVPLVGARTRERLGESLGAGTVQLSKEDMREIDQALPHGAAAGERYNAYLMQGLDSEARTAANG
ncbi:aldo/keto reductase [Fertoebacter nigrum]|uniref:Aldo/keto reductase n=1 Tax=Fertoeibacter niger TaxID=2656921 RepID=A0A8X8H122_9RHOB|nr:aldo/keto reductase [Fertoeibacter niger]NUB45010.1 aldo/keto reductase [Fertoeibacter niger]